MTPEKVKTHNIKNGSKQPDDFDTFLSPVEAARRLGVTRRTFDRWVRGGEVDERWKSGTQYFYHPEAIDALGELRAEEQATTPLDNPAAALLTQAYAHNELLMQRTIDMSTKVSELQEALLTQAMSRVHKLEESHGELIEAREAALSEASERNAVMQREVSAEQRKDRALAWLQDFAPELLKAHQMNKHPAAAFLSTLTPEQVELAVMLGNDGLWTEQQLQMLKDLQSNMAKKAAATGKQKPAEQTPPESEPS